MAQFGWPALIKTALFTAIATSGLWLVAGLVYYERVFSPAGKAAVTAAPSTAPVPLAGKTAIAMAAPVKAPAPQLAPPPWLAPGTLQIPVVGVKASALVDTFTDSRSEGRVHDAIDIPAPRGTPVVVAAGGTVEKLFTSARGGLTVYVRSTDRRVIYYYAHLDGYAPGLAEGQVLPVGAPLGFVGSTGNADPAVPHLHFAVMVTMPEAKWSDPTTAINPFPLFAGPR